MRGIILAGGSGTRLHPMTQVVSKQLLPVYDKPMIYYPLSTLMLAGIREILVISTPRDLPLFQRAARRRRAMGHAASLRRAAAPRGPGAGLHHRRGFRRAASRSALVLGDNLFYGHGLSEMLRDAAARERPGATVFAYHVTDPERYGVVAFDDERPRDLDRGEARRRRNRPGR